MLKRVALQTYGLVVGGATLMGMYEGLHLEGDFSVTMDWSAIGMGKLTLTTKDSIRKAGYVGLKVGLEAAFMPLLTFDFAARLLWCHFSGQEKN